MNAKVLEKLYNNFNHLNDGKIIEDLNMDISKIEVQLDENHQIMIPNFAYVNLALVSQ